MARGTKRPAEVNALVELFGSRDTVTEAANGWMSYCPVLTVNGDGPIYCGERLFVARQEDGSVRFEPSCGHTVAEVVAAMPSTNGKSAAPPAPGRRAQLTPASAIRSERVRWLETGRIPLRGQTVVAGEKGLGKSIYTNAYLPAQLTRGKLDGELHGKPVDVLVASAEDDWRAVVKPRLQAHGADLDRVHRLEVRDEAGEMLLTLPDDVPLVEDAIALLREQGRTVGALVIDPISAFLSEATDSHKDASVRRAIAPLAVMADRQDIAVVVVAHLTKDESKRLISRVSGSMAFVNAARSVLGYARDPGDPDGEQGAQRVLVHVASNWGRYAPTLGVTIESRDIDVDDGSRTDVGYFNVTGEVDVGIEDLQRVDLDDLAADDRQEAIVAALRDGARPSRDVKAAVVAELGCSRRTIERAAVEMQERGDLDITSGGWPRTTTWALTVGGDSTVATAPDTPCVATEQTRMAEPNDADRNGSSDSGDTPHTREQDSR
jgi:hypothetical protein